MNISFSQFIILILLAILFFGDLKKIIKNIKKLIQILKQNLK